MNDPLDVLLKTLKELPHSSGVYEFFDESQRLLYVGKAKNLKKRVYSYFKFSPSLSPSPKLSIRIQKMITETKHLRYLLTHNEQDALILENSLIKQLKPKYNILLRDDKTYPYIYYNASESFPRLDITRKVINDKNIHYFGPYVTGAKEILNSIYELLPLVQKKSCLKGKKSCLFYQIDRCLAPCEQKVNQDEYGQYFKQALKLLQTPTLLTENLTQKMQRLSEALRFEEATEIRDRIIKIKSTQSHSQIDVARLEDIDILGLSKTQEYIMLVWMFMRNGKIVSSSNQLLKNNSIEEEIYTRAILNRFTEEMPLPPKEILIPIELPDKILLQDYIHTQCNTTIKITCPKKGKKKELLHFCQINAEESLRVAFEKDNEHLILMGIKALFNLQEEPFRIECFDTSHLQQQACVGSMVTYENGHFIKEDFRHFNLVGKDEYTQMNEMLTRRAMDFPHNPPPDLWLLDGGSGQITLAKEILESCGVKIDVLGIAKEKLDHKAHRAKGSSKDIIRDENHKAYRLLPTDKRLQFLQKIRDEAHRFAITFHRKKKYQNDLQINLLNIKGIGKQTIKRLLQYFGSFDQIHQASFEELKEIVGEKMAALIKEGD